MEIKPKDGLGVAFEISFILEDFLINSLDVHLTPSGNVTLLEYYNPVTQSLVKTEAKTDEA